ncbi:hypothetical protein [Leptodesmis sichuanensis]|uniref:hypothetical protein n=1 Tax=Leptodesmis sichuanensis TaxID=2906798 RepID=UPI0036F44777
MAPMPCQAAIVAQLSPSKSIIHSVREVPTLLLMRLAFGTGLCRFGMFRAVRAYGSALSIESNQSISNQIAHMNSSI